MKFHGIDLKFCFWLKPNKKSIWHQRKEERLGLAAVSEKKSRGVRGSQGQSWEGGPQDVSPLRSGLVAPPGLGCFTKFKGNTDQLELKPEDDGAQGLGDMSDLESRGGVTRNPVQMSDGVSCSGPPANVCQSHLGSWQRYQFLSPTQTYCIKIPREYGNECICVYICTHGWAIVLYARN